jgi:hypothetical protein
MLLEAVSNVVQALGDAAEQAVHARNVVRLRMNMDTGAGTQGHEHEQGHMDMNTGTARYVGWQSPW